jgi:predicted ATPase
LPLRLTSVSAEFYRSIRRIQVPVEPLTVLVGKNGVGKTNLYRSLELLAAAALGTITREIAEEGGFDSVLWAGPRAKGPVRLKLGAEFDEYFYSIEVGLPAPLEGALTMTEPMVKAEELVHRSRGKAVTLMKRQGPSAWLRDGEGRRQSYDEALIPSETALAGFRDQGRFTELDLVRRALLDWRFYHDFRTDKTSPIRQPALAITTPTLSSDGYDLAAAMASVIEIRGETHDIDAAIEDAFPGATLVVEFGKGTVSIGLKFPDLPRPLGAHELSDGTLHFLCLVAALSGYRLPGFIALNEPETSLHPDLTLPLARLIARAAERTQVWIVTHSQALAEALEREAGVAPYVVVKEDGATWIEGLKLFGEFAGQE